MRLHGFGWLGRRLSYANVMATIAFFFALTGGAMATSKYLVATDTIPQTSDLAGSTYGNPLIADGKVTSGKIADGAIVTSKFDPSATAPNAAKLGGMDASAFPTIIASGTITLSGTNVALGQCATGEVEISDVNIFTDHIVVTAPYGRVSATGFPDIIGVDTPGVGISACNGNSFTTSVDGPYHYLILR
jgi:hypothetical protein